MVNELKDDEILSFLMSSDFTELSNDELSFLLIKFRYFYRISTAKYEQINYKIEDLNKEIQELKEANIKASNLHLESIAILEDKLNFSRNRKLSIKERWNGKITEVNESKQI